ncbi:MAG: hypothetical protein HY231_13880 [Acidobacteria bacterium]|nr:hypothetical protein [Acidobacteriota bacterium]
MSSDVHRNRNLDEQLAGYVAEQSGSRPLLVNIVSEIERLELIIAQQYQSLEVVEQSMADLELDTLDEIYNESVFSTKQKPIARFSNDHQRKWELRRRLRANQSFAALVESRRSMIKEKARLSARLHRLEAYRSMLLCDLNHLED